MRNEYYYQYLMRILHTDVRIYDREGNRTGYFGYSLKCDPLATDPAFEQSMLGLERKDYPVIYSDGYPLNYGILFLQGSTIIIGPVNNATVHTQCEGMSIASFMKKKHNVSSGWEVPCCTFDFFCEEIMLLFHAETGTSLTYEKLMEMNYMTEDLLETLYEENHDIQFAYHENQMTHNPYSREQRTLECIRNGDEEGLIQSLDEVFSGEYGVLAKNPLRSEKNLSIVGLALATRAAIEGGMTYEASFYLSDSYIRKVDEAASIGEARALLRHGQIEYCRIVRGLKNENSSPSRLVEDCKNMIFRRLHSKIRIASLAEELGVTQEYLATVFKKETGQTITDYILRNKILLSENMLMYSDCTIAEIGSYLGFDSQSHYGRVFKKYKGESPSSFRNHYKKNRLE